MLVWQVGVVVMCTRGWAVGSESEAPGDVAKFSVPQRSFSTSHWSCFDAAFLHSEIWLRPSSCESQVFILTCLLPKPNEKVLSMLHVCGLVSTMLIFWQQLGDNN